MTDTPYKGPYILVRVEGELRFLPAKQDENGVWLVMTPKEKKEAGAQD